MKPWLLIVSILVIIAIVCSPVLAISKLELIAFYKGEPAPDMSVGVMIINYTTPIPTPTPTPYIPSWYSPTPVPIAKPHDIPWDYGSLYVVSNPEGALVYLDGILRGTTPITITDVHVHSGSILDSTGKWIGWNGGPKTHEIKLTKIGYQDSTISGIQVAAGKTTSVSVALTPISNTNPVPLVPGSSPTQTPAGTESLTVKSDPGFASVYFDGQFKGVTPLVLSGLSPGSHQLKLTKLGYDNTIVNVTIYAGGTCRGNIGPYDGCKNWLPCITLMQLLPSNQFI